TCARRSSPGATVPREELRRCSLGTTSLASSRVGEGRRSRSLRWLLGQEQLAIRHEELLSGAGAEPADALRKLRSGIEAALHVRIVTGEGVHGVKAKSLDVLVYGLPEERRNA